MSAKRFSTPSAPRRTCSSTGADCADGCPPCSAATRDECGWPTRLPSPCQGLRSSSTARRSGWPKTSVPGRLAVRTPMQWTAGDNGGFSKAQKRRLTRPFADALYGPQRVNAADQRHDHQSFWWFMRNLIYTYRQQPEIGWSTAEVL